MGLESASMRQCLLWYNFIVWGMRTAGPKTQTDPWYGGFTVLLEAAMCVWEFWIGRLVFNLPSLWKTGTKGRGVGGGGRWCCRYDGRLVTLSLWTEQLGNKWVSDPQPDKKIQISPEILQPPHITAAAPHGGATITTRSYGQSAVFSKQPVEHNEGISTDAKSASFLCLYGYQQVTSRVILCSICAAEASWDVNSIVNRL